MNRNVLWQKAKHVLARNWTGRYTRPGPRLYPHQWSWDSAFIAIGYSRFHSKKAQTELLSLFEGQWKNGMVPHIVYHEPSDEYFPPGEFWQTSRSRDAPQGALTSGLTQPPLHATAVRHIYDRATDRHEALAFVRHIFPHLMASHRFLYSSRDVDDIGLVASVHPWETGIDNSPKWDSILASIAVDGAPAVRFKRKDLRFVSAEERPTHHAYERFVYLAQLFKEWRYRQDVICEKSPFLVYDVLFNSVLHRANLDLLDLASLLGEDCQEIERWVNKAEAAFEQILWDHEEKTYHSYDARRRRLIKARTASCALPLFASIPTDESARHIRDRLHKVCPFHREDICVAVPTYDRSQDGFEASNYWRGPIWVNINWMLHQGLIAYGFDELAVKIRRNILRLVEQLGFYEYYYPIELRGLGSSDFSWTAALAIDLLGEQNAAVPRQASDKPFPQPRGTTS